MRRMNAIISYCSWFFSPVTLLFALYNAFIRPKICHRSEVQFIITTYADMLTTIQFCNFTT